MWSIMALVGLVLLCVVGVNVCIRSGRLLAKAVNRVFDKIENKIGD